jgi:hypothetical protein
VTPSGLNTLRLPPSSDTHPGFRYRMAVSLRPLRSELSRCLPRIGGAPLHQPGRSICLHVVFQTSQARLQRPRGSMTPSQLDTTAKVHAAKRPPPLPPNALRGSLHVFVDTTRINIECRVPRGTSGFCASRPPDHRGWSFWVIRGSRGGHSQRSGRRAHLVYRAPPPGYTVVCTGSHNRHMRGTGFGTARAKW